MLSRVQRLLQVFILEKMDESYIRTSHKALKELNRLTQISRNKNPTPWEDSKLKLKIASLNCAGLQSHYEDIITDKKLQRANIIHFSEISMEKHNERQPELNGYNYHFISPSMQISSVQKTWIQSMYTGHQMATQLSS